MQSPGRGCRLGVGAALLGLPGETGGGRHGPVAEGDGRFTPRVGGVCDRPLSTARAQQASHITSHIRVHWLRVLAGSLLVSRKIFDCVWGASTPDPHVAPESAVWPADSFPLRTGQRRAGQRLGVGAGAAGPAGPAVQLLRGLPGHTAEAARVTASFLRLHSRSRKRRPRGHAVCSSAPFPRP